MPKFFIERPIFAIVIALLIMLAGGLSILGLPVEQVPPVAPPTVQITTTYPGASAQTVENTVVQVIEQQMSGIDHLIYLDSQSDDTGQSTTTLTFAPGTNPDIAQVQVQNKLQLAVPLLPPQVTQSGIRVTKSTSSFLMVIGFVSSDKNMSKFDIANYIVSNVVDPISRINGVGNLNIFGTQYAMRIWLDAVKLTNYQLTPLDVTSAIQSQNVQVSGGQLGANPAPATQQLNAAITEATLLRTPQDFAAILLKVLPDGSQVLLGDVARIELGPESFNVDNKYNGQPAAGIGIQLATGANALNTANAVRAKLAQLSKYFPQGLAVVYPNDVTPFITASITEVVKTLLEGIALVVLVMLLFLQNWRATIIPAIAIPVVLLGTFGLMAALGFSINTLSMFGMVLAIGLLVDDAIVVVENVERVMTEEGLGPREATKKAMSQISGALVGVALVLAAVFVPVSFSSGTAGAIYREFALTIAAAMLLSVFVALTLTPALCAILLKPGHGARNRFARAFNASFDHGRSGYLHGVRHVIARSGRWFVIYGAVIAAAGLLFVRLPTSFLPIEDQGYLFVQVQTPPGAAFVRTQTALDDVSSYLAQQESRMVEASFQINGFNFAGRGQSQGQIFVRLKDWGQRGPADLTAQALVNRVNAHFAAYKDATIVAVNPPPIRGLGTAAGFDFMLEDVGHVGHEKLMQARNQLLAAAKDDPALMQVRAVGLEDNPTFKIDIDRQRAAALGVTIADVDQTFSVLWGSRYVNNFMDTDNRIKKVYVQADAPFRMNPEDLNNIYVRNAKSAMVPFSSLAKGSWTYGAPKLERYNGVPAIEIQGVAPAGKSLGQAMTAMETLAQKLPSGIGYEWTGISLQQIQAGNQAPYFYALSIIVVFLCLAALYESWAIPLSVILGVPLGVLGALAAATAFGMSNDVFFQVGLLVTIGLSAKNAILIVEFARELHEQGKSVFDAALEAAQLRLRPIIMTSLAFGLGVLPLCISRGAGSASQHAIGIGVLGGMLSATFLAIFLIPMFFVVVSRYLAKDKPVATEAPA
ncbi:MAG TPA: efflux RND transporter permease subunit [Burkholderiales bacterium]|nr:efflux RND transporter permease subunit [Burkholderiales bacterium]